jgi:cephalosporin hydroxylase
MDDSYPATKFELQRKSWSKLRRLRPVAVDLERIRLIRMADPAALRDPGRLANLILTLGLNDDGLSDYPVCLRPYCGQGLRIWQYPEEFGRYLAHLVRLNVRSYMEIGVRHGGTFVATVECLARSGPLVAAVAVDIMPSPSVVQHARLNPSVRFLRVNTQSTAFDRALARMEPFDAVFVDANHDEAECLHEVESVRQRCSAIALHDIANPDFPGVRRVWERICRWRGYRHIEYVSDYSEPHLPMGIGLAVRTNGETGGGDGD